MFYISKIFNCFG